jgi:hypothetical protein
LIRVGARSALDVAWGDFLDWLGVSHKDYSERSYEKDASKRGEEYLKQYMKDPSTEEEQCNYRILYPQLFNYFLLTI